MKFKDKQRTVSTHEFEELQKMMKEIVNEKQNFERIQVTRKVARDIFQHNDMKIKVKILS